MSIEEEVKLILDNINELYSHKTSVDNKNLNNKEKGIQYIVNLEKSLEDKKNYA